MTTELCRRRVDDLLAQELAGRIAIRQLVDAYADCADRRDIDGQMALFTDDVEYVVYADRRNPLPTTKLRGRAALTPICLQLEQYQISAHINGQSTIRIDGARASGVTGSLVHHIKVEATQCIVTLTALHYLDSFVKRNNLWLIRQRQVMVDWTETRTLPPH